MITNDRGDIPVRETGGGKRKSQAAKRKALLLEMALALFSERGYRDTTVRDITRAAGVTEAVLYHYFANKADLLSAVLHVYAPFSRAGDLLRDAAGAELDVTLRDLGARLLGLMRVRRQLLLTLLGEATADRELARSLARFLDAFADDLGGYLTDLQANGQINAKVNVRAAARAFQGALLIQFLSGEFGTDQDSSSDHSDAVAVTAYGELFGSGLRPLP